MAAGGGKPLWGVDIGGVDLRAGKGGRDLLAVDIAGYEEPVEATAGEKREVEGGVGGV
jgi:hypothetical protein